MKQEKTKKEIILDVALTLFSEKGYDGVGVDEIAAKLGMKGPALYYYFKSKDALLDELIDSVRSYYRTHFGSATDLEKYPESVEDFVEMSKKRLEFTIHDPNIRKLRKLLMMEQFRNDKLRMLTTQYHIFVVEDLNREIIKHLIKNGKMKDYDPDVLAFEFSAPVSMMIHWIDREPDKEPVAMERIHRHMEHFVEMYGIDER